MNIVDIKEKVSEAIRKRMHGTKKSLYEYAEESFEHPLQYPEGCVAKINKEKSNKEKNLLVIDMTITDPLLIREYLQFLSEKEEGA